MGFWSWLTAAPDYSGITANENPAGTPPTVGKSDYTPGDPNGIELQGEETYSRGLPLLRPSPWDGYPEDWSTPNWQGGINKLVDVAWMCLDLNASILSTMPVYRMQSGRVVPDLPWMNNPDPNIYTSWHEFAKQLFWDYQLGEAFVMPSDFFATGKPQTFRIIPPWMVHVEMNGASREYRIGSLNVTGDILHIRYQSNTIDPRGVGPLDVSDARMVASGVLSRYVTQLARTGGQTHEWIYVEEQLDKSEADDLLDQWVSSRQRHLGEPAVMSGGAKLEQAQSMSAKDMALLELSQYTEARIATMLGVPPFLAGLPSGGDSMTYSNVSQLFDFHDRASLRTKATPVMSALSNWALPRGQRVELNRDEYTRPDLAARATAYATLHGLEDETGRAITADEIRTAERFHGEVSAEALTGGDEL